VLVILVWSFSNQEASKERTKDIWAQEELIPGTRER
jgi:hypothetical protein